MGADLARNTHPCVKAGRPPVETTLMVFLKNEPPRTFKFLARSNDVTFEHAYNLLDNQLADDLIHGPHRRRQPLHRHAFVDAVHQAFAAGRAALRQET